MQNKESLTTVALLAGAVLMLAGCGKSQQPPRPPAPSAPPASQDRPEAPAPKSDAPANPSSSSSDTYDLHDSMPSTRDQPPRGQRRYEWIAV
ncbi:MAG TPA: hypothetical protein VKA13_05430 [Gammaproteobacteria bacterium]|nr:hypothetical protein [Gammaproteobacteria bacterium]